LGEQTAVREKLIELTNRRHALWLSIMVIRRDATTMGETYDNVIRNPEVLAALKTLGGTHRLGPAKNYADDLKKLAEFENIVLTDWVPLFMQGGQQRVTAILNEATPVTFTWTPGSDPTVLTAGMAESAGLKIADEAPTMAISLASGRSVKAKRVQIPYLRLGKHLLRETEAYVLPPEAEDFGARLGGDAFSDWSSEAQPARLRLLLRPPS
jgi:hypothetical protein